MPIDPAGISRMTHKFVTSDGSFLMGHAVLIEGTPLQADLDDWCAAASSAWAENILGLQSVNCTYTNGELKYSSGTSESVGTSTVNTAGGATGGGTIISSACVLSIRTGDFYRGGHGRMYCGGIPSSALLSDKQWNATFVGNMETGFAAYALAVSGITTANITASSFGVTHRYSGGVLLAPPTFSPYTGTRTQRRICSQRRRLGPLVF